MIGIGITTRNRPHYLASALEHFAEYGMGDKLVIVNDASDDPGAYWDVVQPHLSAKVSYRFSPNRLGIARAKNASLAPLMDCDHIFLFDDDAWPIKHGWAEQWIETNHRCGTQHSMWIMNDDLMVTKNVGFRNQCDPKYVWGPPGYQMVAFTNCLGLLMYFTRNAAEKLGGFDTTGGNVYGFEHAQMAQRAVKAGLSRDGDAYIAPLLGHEMVYSVDTSYGMYGLLPPIDTPWINNVMRSVTQAEADGANRNAALMFNYQTYIPLVDPLGESS